MSFRGSYVNNVRVCVASHVDICCGMGIQLNCSLHFDIISDHQNREIGAKAMLLLCDSFKTAFRFSLNLCLAVKVVCRKCAFEIKCVK